MSYLSRFNREFPVFGPMTNWIDDLLGDDSFKSSEFSIPAVNILEGIKHYTLEMAVPGMEKSDFKISVDDRTMTISCEKKTEEKEEDKGKMKRREYNFSKFSRSFTLPSGADVQKIGAAYNNGILSIHIPKMELEVSANSKNISVS
ncbi:MAG: Hsp20/alpha crystallin family protein [Saprospiraceae bacterium]|nr:Hsp20/alpha crystallin family protein [Saprospiraceae bacterium]